MSVTLQKSLHFGDILEHLIDQNVYYDWVNETEMNETG